MPAFSSIAMGVGAATGLGSMIGGLTQSGGGQEMTEFDLWRYNVHTLPIENALLEEMGFRNVVGDQGYGVYKYDPESEYGPTKAGMERLDTEETLAVSQAKAGFGDAMAAARRYGSTMNPAGGGPGYLAQQIPLNTAMNVADIRSQYGLERARMSERGESDRLDRMSGFLSGNQPQTRFPTDNTGQMMFDVGRDLMGGAANLYGMSQFYKNPQVKTPMAGLPDPNMIPDNWWYPTS